MPDEAADIGAGEVEPEELREPAPEMLFGLPVRRSHGQVVLFPSRDDYPGLLRTLHEAGHHMVIDLTGVDYLTHPGRTLPEGVTPERFEVTRESLNIEPLAIMFAKGDAEFKQLVDKEVSRLIVGNDIQRIYRRWFESPIPPKGVNLGLPMSYLLRDSFKAPTDWLPN